MTFRSEINHSIFTQFKPPKEQEHRPFVYFLLLVPFIIFKIYQNRNLHITDTVRINSVHIFFLNFKEERLVKQFGKFSFVASTPQHPSVHLYRQSHLFLEHTFKKKYSFTFYQLLYI